MSGVAAKLDIGALSVSKSDVAAEAVAIDARAADWHVNMKAPRVELREGAVRAANATFDVDAARNGRKVSATVVAAVSAALAARSVELADVRAKFSATGATLPKRGIEGALTGQASIDVRAGRAQGVFSGTVLDSKVKAKLAIADLASPSYT